MFFFFFIISILNLSVYARSFEEGFIYKIDHGHLHDTSLIYLSNGRVIEVKKTLKKRLSDLETAWNKTSPIRIEINSKNNLIDFVYLNKDQRTNSSELVSRSENKNNFKPSIIQNYTKAYQLFKNARRDFKEESQCYHRAHIWSYEWRTNENLYSSKAWLFFTQKYIRKHKFEWWFHVAPMVHVLIDNQVKERIMDIKYSKRPEKINDWTNIFVRSNEACPVVERFSDYANSPESGACFVMKSSMYQYIPLDLEEEEINGTNKTKWQQDEIKEAYLNGLNLTV